MSFILDALRKSENERQRGSIPDVARIPLVVPEPRMPRWALMTMTLLTLLVIGLAAAWWQTQRSGFDGNLGAAYSRPEPASTSTEPFSPTAREVAPRALVETRPSVQAQTGRPPAPRDAAAAAGNATETPALRNEGASNGRPDADAGARVTLRAAAPTRPAAPRSTPPPSLAQVRASGLDVPALELQLHSYSESAARRFVFINGARYSENQTMAAGPRIQRITPTGVVLSYGGSDFMLTVD